MYGINILEYRNLKFNGMGLDLVITSFTNSTFTLQLKLLVKVCYGLFYEIMVIERKKNVPEKQEEPSVGCSGRLKTI